MKGVTRGLSSRYGQKHHDEREPGAEKEGQAGEHESRIRGEGEGSGKDRGGREGVSHNV